MTQRATPLVCLLCKPQPAKFRFSASPPWASLTQPLAHGAVQPKASKLSERLLDISGTITALGNVTVVQQFAATSSLDGTYSTQNGLVYAQPVRCEEGWVMSSYARYCQDQATA
jgi:hypothetical protein